MHYIILHGIDHTYRLVQVLNRHTNRVSGPDPPPFGLLGHIARKWIWIYVLYLFLHLLFTDVKVLVPCSFPRFPLC